LYWSFFDYKEICFVFDKIGEFLVTVKPGIEIRLQLVEVVAKIA